MTTITTWVPSNSSNYPQFQLKLFIFHYYTIQLVHYVKVVAVDQMDT